MCSAFQQFGHVCSSGAICGASGQVAGPLWLQADLVIHRSPNRCLRPRYTELHSAGVSEEEGDPGLSMPSSQPDYGLRDPTRPDHVRAGRTATRIGPKPGSRRDRNPQRRHSSRVKLRRPSRRLAQIAAYGLVEDLWSERKSGKHKAESYRAKKAPGRNLPSGSVAILPLQIDGKKF